MNRLFGTDGVRGVAGLELTPDLAFRLGQAGAYVLSKQTVGRPKILVGKDTRQSGDMLECALMAGICSVGAEAVALGVVPTPAVAYLTKQRGAAAGVVISASHNPAKYNGIKFFSGNGYKLPDDTEDAIQAALEAGDMPLCTRADIGRVVRDDTAAAAYIAFAESTVSCRLDGLRIAVDCANGASSAIAPQAFADMGASVTAICNAPDGMNINAGCGSTHIEQLSDCVAQGNFDIGIAFDGDADRVLFVDECGKLIDGDCMMAACAIALRQAGKLRHDTVVATVMSNLGLTIACEKHGIRVVKTAVGDRYVLEEMQKSGYVLGGEQSGHVIFSSHVTTGDGLVSALQFLQIMRTSGKKASELASVVTILPQVLVNASVANDKKHAYTEDAVIMAEIARIEALFAGQGRVLIRPSGTEPRVRVMLEGTDGAQLQHEATALAQLIETRLR